MDERHLGKYQIIDEIGKGGFATVYRARDLDLDREVALKVLDPLLTRDPVWVARFRREARAVASLDHPRVVTVHEIGQAEGVLYIAMKLVEGGSLTQRLADQGPLPWDETVRITGEIAETLDFAHNSGILHRDMKPANVLLDERTGAVLTDFGFARLVADNTLSVSLGSGAVGTPAYIAPEIWEGEEATAQTDIYALGCMVYEMVTGEVLFTGATPPAVMRAHFKPRQLPVEWPGGTPDGFSEVLETALAQEPNQRYASAGELAAALARLSEDRLAAPYADLQAALVGQHWQEALALAGQIRATDPHYRDVQALEQSALAGLERTARQEQAALWRAEAEQAFEEGDFKGAELAAVQWRDLDPDDIKLAGFVLLLQKALSPSTPKHPTSESTETTDDLYDQSSQSSDNYHEPSSATPIVAQTSRQADTSPWKRPRSFWLVAALVGIGLATAAVIWLSAVTVDRTNRSTVGDIQPTAERAVQSTEVAVQPTITNTSTATLLADLSGAVGGDVSEPTPTPTKRPPTPTLKPTTIPTPSVIEVRYNLGTEPPTLDPSLANDTNTFEVAENLFLGLTGFDEQGNVEPELATDWSASEDGLTYTFNMRDDATWVNYTPSGGVVELGPVTADEIVYSVKRTCNPETGSNYAYVDYIIKGCQDWNSADTASLSAQQTQQLSDRVGVTAVDDHTVRFELTQPAPYFPAIAGMWMNRAVPKDTIEQFGETWTEAGKIVTNGPYVLAEWFHNDRMVLEKNPQWYGWADAEGNIDRFEMSMIQEASTAFAMYKAGELDTTLVPLPELDSVKTDPVLGQELVIAPFVCTYYYDFVTTKPPVDNVLVRKALSAAIDRKSLVDNVLKGGQIPANTFAPSMIFGNAAEDPDIAPWALSEEQGGTGYTAAVEQAQAWLAEAGYPGGEGFPAITLMHNTSEAHAQIAHAIQAMWEKALNIDVTVENQEWRVYLDTIRKDTPIEQAPHVYRLGWCADYPDENNWVHEVFNTDAGRDDPRWEAIANAPLGPDGKSFNQLTEEAQAKQDPMTRAALYKAAEKILTDDGAAIAPIYYYTTLNMTKPYLDRTYFDFGGNHFETWYVDWRERAKVE